MNKKHYTILSAILFLLLIFSVEWVFAVGGYQENTIRSIRNQQYHDEADRQRRRIRVKQPRVPDVKNRSLMRQPKGRTVREPKSRESKGLRKNQGRSTPRTASQLRRQSNRANGMSGLRTGSQRTATGLKSARPRSASGLRSARQQGGQSARSAKGPRQQKSSLRGGAARSRQSSGLLSRMGNSMRQAGQKARNSLSGLFKNNNKPKNPRPNSANR